MGEECDGSAKQKWDLHGENYAVHTDSGKCMDVQAAKKPDGSYEKWDEIKTHTTVNVQLTNATMQRQQRESTNCGSGQWSGRQPLVCGKCRKWHSSSLQTPTMA